MFADNFGCGFGGPCLADGLSTTDGDPSAGLDASAFDDGAMDDGADAGRDVGVDAGRDVGVDTGRTDAGALDSTMADSGGATEDLLCASSTTAPLNGTLSGTTIGGTRKHTPDRNCAKSNGAERAFKLSVSSRLSRLVVDTLGSEFDTVLSIYRGCPLTGTLLSCNDDTLNANSLTSEIELAIVEPGEYFIVVDGFADAQGNFSLNIYSQ